jgi:uncharacterized protein
MELKGAHVLVTGASRGIGAAMAEAFNECGAHVSLAARSRTELESLAGRLGGTPFPVDLLDTHACDDLVPRVEAQCGPIDVLVNNAGLDNNQWLHEVDPQVIRNVTRLNLETPMILTRAVLPGMLQRGRGHLVATSSLAGTAGVPGLAPYSASKAGLNNFMAALRLELRDTPIRTTLIATGPVDTAMWDHIEENDDFHPVFRRLRRVKMLPKTTPKALATRTVAAVAHDRRHVRAPRRLLPAYWLGESPRRITEAMLAKVPLVIPPKDGGTR